MGYTPFMTNPRLEDHVVGLELQLVELVEQRERATIQHRPADAAGIQREIDALQEEMARAAEEIARADAGQPNFNDVDEVRLAS